MEKDELFEAQVAAWLENQNKIYHTPVDLGINQFKKYIRATGLSKKMQNAIIKRWKRRAWMEFDGIAKGRGNAPTYRTNKKTIEVEHSEEVTVVEVKNGHK